MRLTQEQLNAVRCEENLLLTACPGSGKTRVIISKLVRVIDEVRGSARRVGCITYTNAAVYEIESRLQQHMQQGDEIYYDVCTIHSFCLNHIFRPFCHLIKGYKKGFKVLTPESAEFEKIVLSVCAKHGRYNLNFRDFEEFTQLRMTPEGEPAGVGLERGALTLNMAKDYWTRIRKEGFVDFANIIYYSLLLLKKRPEILGYISSRFAWLLVDEFQDTTDLQTEILALIAERNCTRFLLVGDPYQSIFRFAGARPDLAEAFAGRIAARTDLNLSGNFRSSQPILDQAESLYSRTPSMLAIGPARTFKTKPKRQHGQSAFAVITDYFLPTLESLNIPIGDAAILAPSWFTLFPLGRRLREYGVSIVGPGARPYRRNRQFAPLAEQVCGYLMEARPTSIPAIERTLFNTILDVTGRACFDVFSYKGRITVFQLLACANTLQKKNCGAIRWLEMAADAFSQVLIKAEYFSPSELDILSVSVEEMKADMREKKVDLENMTTADLGIYASPDSSLKLSTLHNAKGREYAGVALIDLHEGKLPSYYARTNEDLEEQKRLFYVGVTRAKQYLLYITDDSGKRNGYSRFLKLVEKE